MWPARRASGEWARRFRELLNSANGVELVDHRQDADPFSVCREDLRHVTSSLTQAMREYESSPVLERAASFLYWKQRERFRPGMVLLMGRIAVEGHSGRMDRHRKLAEVVEMLHIGSRLHDQVVDDNASSRASNESSNIVSSLGNGLSLLAGDFLIARSVTLLAELRNCEVVEMMANVEESLARGEALHSESPFPQERFDDYENKTFHKSAALLAYAAKSVMVLENLPSSAQKSAFAYGLSLGMAYRMSSDVRKMETFLGQSRSNGEIRELLSHSATGPVVHAAEESKWFADLLGQTEAFEEKDLAAALEVVRKSGGIERTAGSALLHANEAIEHANNLTTDPELKSALVNMVNHVMNRDEK